MHKRLPPLLLLLLVAVAVVALDQGSKWLVLQSLRLQAGGHYDLIPDCFQLVLVHNPGAAWGMLAGRQKLLALISLGVTALLLLGRARITAGWRERDWALGLLLGGIMGNFFDRLLRPGVVDFLRCFISTASRDYEWPSFNLADSGICIGVGLFILSTFLRPDAPAPSTPLVPPAA